MVAHIAYEPGILRLLDQRALPGRIEIIEIRDWRGVSDAIARMVVRGAPAIGITAAYGMALAAHAAAAERHDVVAAATRAAESLRAARPTAVNLVWAVDRVLDAIRERSRGGDDASALSRAAAATARAIHEEDVDACRRIGDAGAALLDHGATVLTICNTGSLATGGYGTALGIVRSAHAASKLEQVLVAETRPRLQGARLTTWELLQDGIPHTLITDSMAATFMRQGKVSAVIAGADRIAANGDVANKIGTYALAVLARAHGVPFIVAAPLSTFDAATESGDSIPIEYRDPSEVTEVGGIAIAPAATNAANPAFDVTPSELIDAIVTEAGVVRSPWQESIGSILRAARPRAVSAS